jgi:hypothetical protein
MHNTLANGWTRIFIQNVTVVNRLDVVELEAEHTSSHSKMMHYHVHNNESVARVVKVTTNTSTGVIFNHSQPTTFVVPPSSCVTYNIEGSLVNSTGNFTLDSAGEIKVKFDWSQSSVTMHHAFEAEETPSLLRSVEVALGGQNWLMRPDDEIDEVHRSKQVLTMTEAYFMLRHGRTTSEALSKILTLVKAEAQGTTSNRWAFYVAKSGIASLRRAIDLEVAGGRTGQAITDANAAHSAAQSQFTAGNFKTSLEKVQDGYGILEPLNTATTLEHNCDLHEH